MSLFGRKKTKITVTPKDPVFYVRFIGSVETFTAAGRGCTRLPVQKIWDGSDEEQNMKRVSLSMSTTGIRVKDLENKRAKEQVFDIKRISYCNADSDINRIFSWIYRHPDVKKIECFAVLCNSVEKAQAMALVLSRAFQIAYRDWKREQTRYQRQSSLKQERSKLTNGNTQAHSSTNGESAGDIGAELSNGVSHMNITTQDDNTSQCSSENNIRIIDEDTEEELSHNAAVQALATGDTSVDDVDNTKGKK